MSQQKTTRRADPAAIRRKQGRRQIRRRRWTIGAVVLAMVAIVAVGFLVNRVRDATTDVAAPEAGSSEYGVTIGDPQAPHEIVIYEDFLCPFCGDLETATREELAQLADDGRVYVEYRPFELLSQVGDYSARSTNAFAVVLQESGPEVAQRFHDLLFEHQPSESGPFPDDEMLVDLAVRAGAEESEVHDAVTTGRETDWVDAATKSAVDAGVQGTPTILLNGQVFQDGRTVEELADNLVSRVR